jgi:hypothetical protein
VIKIYQTRASVSALVQFAEQKPFDFYVVFTNVFQYPTRRRGLKPPIFDMGRQGYNSRARGSPRLRFIRGTKADHRRVPGEVFRFNFEPPFC